MRRADGVASFCPSDQLQRVSWKRHHVRVTHGTTYRDTHTTQAATKHTIVSSSRNEQAGAAHLVMMELSRVDDGYVAICQRLSSRLEPVVNLMRNVDARRACPRRQM